MYDFRAMAIFVAVIQHQSMREAAKQLGLGVSTISLAITKLEQQHQIKLVNRTTRRLSATSAGETFYQACLQMMMGAECAQQVLEQQKNDVDGTLRITSFSSVCGLPIAGSLKTLLADYPALNIEWYVDDNFSNLYTQKIDIAIRGGQHALNDPQLIARKLFDAEMCLCATPEFLASGPPIAHPRDLAQHQWLDYQATSYRFTHLTHGEITVHPALRMLCNNSLLSLTLLQNHFGIGVRARAELHDEFERGRLVQLLPDWRLDSSPVYLITLNREQPARVRLALDRLSEAFAQRCEAA